MGDDPRIPHKLLRVRIDSAFWPQQCQYSPAPKHFRLVPAFRICQDSPKRSPTKLYFPKRIPNDPFHLKLCFLVIHSRTLASKPSRVSARTDEGDFVRLIPKRSQTR